MIKTSPGYPLSPAFSLGETQMIGCEQAWLGWYLSGFAATWAAVALTKTGDHNDMPNGIMLIFAFLWPLMVLYVTVIGSIENVAKWLRK